MKITVEIQRFFIFLVLLFYLKFFGVISIIVLEMIYMEKKQIVYIYMQNLWNLRIQKRKN